MADQLWLRTRIREEEEVLSVVTALCTIFWQLHMHETCTPDATVAECKLLAIAKFLVVAYLIAVCIVDEQLL